MCVRFLISEIPLYLLFGWVVHLLCGLLGVAILSTRDLISHKDPLTLFLKSQLPHKFVNVSFIITDVKNKLTDLCEN